MYIYLQMREKPEGQHLLSLRDQFRSLSVAGWLDGMDGDRRVASWCFLGRWDEWARGMVSL